MRIARVFGVTTDYLLMDETQAPPKQTPPPQYQETSNLNEASSKLEHFIRRHGYKSGYVMIAIGAVICLISLGMFLLFPAVGSVMNSTMDSFLTDGVWGSSNIIVDGNLPDDLPQDVLDQIIDDVGQDSYTSFFPSVEKQFESTLWFMSGIFLLLMIPGLAFIGVGIVVVVKGKQIAARTTQII